MQLHHCVRSPETFKCTPPEETVERLEAAFGRLGLDLSYWDGRLSQDVDIWWSRVRIPANGAIAAGKGVSPVLAKASALAELAERVSAGLYFRTLRFRGVYASPPPELLGSASAGYAGFRCYDYLNGYTRGSEDAVADALPLASLLKPKLVSEDRLAEVRAEEVSQHWVDGFSLTRQRKVRVPLALIDLASGTNGLASGNTLEEAIIQGTSEVFERYAAVTAVVERRRLPTIDPASVPASSSVRQFRDYCRERGIEILIKDFSLGQQLPCIGIVVTDPRMGDADNPLKTAFARQRFRVGAGPSPSEALTRSFTEEVQSRWRVLADDDTNPYDILWHKLFKHLPVTWEPPNSHYTLLRSYEYADDLSFLVEGETIDFPADPEHSDCLAEIRHYERLCAELGSELIVVDQTHPVLQVPTVRIIVPGLSAVLCRLDQKPDLDLQRLAEITDDFSVRGMEFYRDDRWVDVPRRSTQLITELTENIRQNHALQVHSMGLPRRPIQSLMLLAPLLYEQGELTAFEACCRTLAFAQPQSREAYESLADLAAGQDLTGLGQALGDDAVSRLLHLTETPRRNPFRESAAWDGSMVGTDDALGRLMQSFYAQ